MPFPWSCLLPNTMSFMSRVNTRRGARSVNQTMWRTCGVFCAWILLFLTDVCAQSQRRYRFIFFFKFVLKEGACVFTRPPAFTITGLNTFFSSFDAYIIIIIIIIIIIPSRPVFTCGGNITADSGVIGSQGYPGVYPPNTKCVWKITVSPAA